MAAQHQRFAGVIACFARQALGRGRYASPEELCRLQASEDLFLGPSYISHSCRSSFTVHCYKTGCWKFLLVALHHATLTQGGRVDSACQALRFLFT